jgi:FkbM family methyltransferase
VIGFEPDARAYGQLKNDERYTWINAALYEDENPATLYITTHQTNTSLLRPNRKTIDPIYQNPNDFEIIKEVTVPCTTLDQVSVQLDILPTALKIDTQGSELSVLKGANTCLENALLAIELEVEFVPLYQDQALFGEIDTFLRDKGFILLDLGNLLSLKRGRYGFHQERKGQLIAADALYFRSPDNLLSLTKQSASIENLQLICKYCAVCAIYGYRNLALEALELLHSHSVLMDQELHTLKNAIGFSGYKNHPTQWPGLGRVSKYIRRFSQTIEPKNNAIWINDLGNLND